MQTMSTAISKDRFGLPQSVPIYYQLASRYGVE